MDITTVADKVSDKLDKAIRAILTEVHNRLDLRSPVGNPDLWLSLHHSYSIKSHRKQKRGTKAPKGYTGGHFRANWQHGYAQAPKGEIKGEDKSGSATRSRVKASINSTPSAGIHYIMNNLPYASRLENGWSSQAPQGMVGLLSLIHI